MGREGRGKLGWLGYVTYLAVVLDRDWTRAERDWICEYRSCIGQSSSVRVLMERLVFMWTAFGASARPLPACCTVSPFLLFSSLLFSSLRCLLLLLSFPLLSIRLSFSPSPPLLSLRSRCFSFSLFNRAARFLFRAASDPRISVIRAASLEERHCLLTRVVVEWLVAFPLPPRPPRSWTFAARQSRVRRVRVCARARAA